MKNLYLPSAALESEIDEQWSHSQQRSTRNGHKSHGPIFCSFTTHVPAPLFSIILGPEAGRLWLNKQEFVLLVANLLLLFAATGPSVLVTLQNAKH